MIKLLNWYWHHFLRAFELEVYRPWQKEYWTSMRAEVVPHQLWQSSFWHSSIMKRTGSFMVVILGMYTFAAFIFALGFTLGLILQAI